MNVFKNIKPLWLLFLKVIVVASVLFYLIKKELITVKSLMIFYNKPIEMGFIAFLTFFILSGLVTLRWKLIANAGGIPATYLMFFKIIWISQFFSTFLPGVLVPDGVKTAYLIKAMTNKNKTFIATTIIVDRLIGLYGLTLLASIASTTLLINKMLSNDTLIFAQLCVGLFLLLNLSVFVGFFLLKLFQSFIERKKWMPRIILVTKSLVQAVDLYRGEKVTLTISLMISVAVQFILAMIVLYIARIMYGGDINGIYFLAVVPIGELTTLVPVGPLGIGVSHLSFQYLFEMIKQVGGAEIFNTFMLIRLTIALFGLFPFIYGVKKLQAGID